MRHEQRREERAHDGASLLEARASCIREIVEGVREMIARVEASGDGSKLRSLRSLAGHYEAELERVLGQLASGSPPPAL